MDLATDSPLTLTRCDPARNMARFYRMDLIPTLFGEVALIRTWGRIGTCGRDMAETFEDVAMAEVARDKLERVKRRRGYRSDAVDPDIGPGYGAPMDYRRREAR